MSWGSLRGHEEAVGGIKAALQSGRLPHAMLFVGPGGIGKHLAARLLAKALLCERVPPERFDPCGVCPACVMVEGGTHPDLLEVGRPEDRTELPIAVIRQLCIDLGLKPARDGRRIAIVDDADDLSDEAANAFLKTLEEPPPTSLLILLGTSPELQLETIRSRCRIVPFRPLAEADVAAILLERNAVESPAEARRLAKLGEGSVGRALGLADPALAAFRRGLIDELARENGFDAAALARRIDAFAKEASAKEAGPRRRRAILIIGELVGLFRSLLWQTAGLEPPAADPADRAAIGRLAAQLEPEEVFALADRCMIANYQIQRMVYLPVVLDALCAELGRVINPPRAPGGAK